MTVPFMSYALPAAAQLVSGIIGGHSASSAAAEQRRWEERMANTAYQRAVKDLRAAGLNPALAYGQGGAATPSAGIADVPKDVLGSAVRTGLSARQAAADLDLTQSQASNAKQQAAVNNALAYKVQHDIDYVDAQRAYVQANTSGTTARALLDRARLPGVLNQRDAELWLSKHPLLRNMRGLLSPSGVNSARSLLPTLPVE